MRSRMPSYSWVYVIKLKSSHHYYIGATRNLLIRIGAHTGQKNSSEGSAYVKKYGFDQVIATYWTNTFRDALHLEEYLWRLCHTTYNWIPPNLTSKEQIEEVLKKARKLPLRGYITRIEIGWGELD